MVYEAYKFMPPQEV